MKKILFFFNELKATFWFIPVLIIALSIFLSMGLVGVDKLVDLPEDWWGNLFFVSSASSGRSILTTISGAMIGAAGTVFSITLVALTLASSQFGPRLIKNFMYVRLNQIVLGSYVSTYLYCLFILNAIKEIDGYTFIPSISIFIAIIIAVLNIVLLIVFIHQIATSIQADSVISDISKVINGQIHELFPKDMGQGKKKNDKIDLPMIKSNYTDSIDIKSTKNGYFQYIDNEMLMEEVCEFKGMLELKFKPGDYLVNGVEIGTLFTNKKVDEEDIEKITHQFVTGDTKNSQQDLEFSILQMVEIASRALSPGVNDPFTAITCIDNLSATLCHLSQVNFPSRFRVDKDNHLRVVMVTLSFEDYLDTSFNQIRQYSAGCTSVILKLMDALITIGKFTNKEEHKKALVKHAKMVLNVGKESLKEENDLQIVIERSKNII